MTKDPIQKARDALMAFFAEEDLDPMVAMNAMIQISAKISRDAFVEQDGMEDKDGLKKFVSGCKDAWRGVSVGRLLNTSQKKLSSKRPLKVIDGGKKKSRLKMSSRGAKKTRQRIEGKKTAEVEQAIKQEYTFKSGYWRGFLVGTIVMIAISLIVIFVVGR